MAQGNGQKLMKRILTILEKHGKKAFQMARDSILEEKVIQEPVYEALRYFMEESWYDVQHPALLSLTCEAVGGDSQTTTRIGAAMVLLAGAADIHDDIIDKSLMKSSKPTVYGKFGKDISLLAGDALLFKGSMLLNEACKDLPQEQGRAILKVTEEAFYQIGSAEAKEIALRERDDLTPEDYREIIELKAAVAEANARIGAILGGGSPEDIEALAHYGRTLGFLMTIRDDFIDIYEPDELKNRTENECLPLPILYAFRNSEKKGEITHLLEKEKITEQESQEILDLLMNVEEVQELRSEMRRLAEKAQKLVTNVERNRDILTLMLDSTLEDL